MTGIGLVTPLGVGREKTWQALLNGQSGVREGRESGFPCLSAPVRDLDVPPTTRMLSMSFLAAAEALRDSGLDVRLMGSDRIGCTVSASKPNLYAHTHTLDTLSTDTLGRQLYRVFGLGGPLRNIVAACATGTNAIILGAQWIQQGICDAVIAGAAESSLAPLYMAGFRSLGVLGEKAVKPFDRQREGFAMGEGAGIVILERRDSALLRGAKVYGEVAGYAIANDFHHAVAFAPDGSSISSAIRRAMDKGGTEAVDYINAHGTATLLNDVIETRGIRGALGKKARDVSISSTKAATGHLLGASGAVEASFALLALRDNVVPPTLNLQEPDPECDLDYTPGKPRFRPVNTAMSLSFGFGGQIGVITVTKV